MIKEIYPVRWTGEQAVVTLPEHIDASNAGQVCEELLALINRGAAALIADMTATLSCDYAGADAMARAYKRAVVSGTQLRLVVAARIVSRVLTTVGLDRLLPIYPSLEAATARTPAEVIHPVPPWAEPALQSGPGAAVITPAVLWKLIDALPDGVALTDDEGMLALVNRRTTDMFGYGDGELAGRPVESLIPVGVRASRRSHRATYAQAPTAWPMRAGARPVGLRKDGVTFPVEISLSPVPTTAGQFTLILIRDVSAQRDDPVGPPRAAGPGRASGCALAREGGCALRGQAWPGTTRRNPA